MGPARVHIHTLGCPKNDADSAGLGRRLRAAGVATVHQAGQASHILINTCGFIEDAKAESVGAILEATAAYPDATVLVMGCLVQRYKDELQDEIPEVAGWYGLGEVEILVSRLAQDRGSSSSNGAAAQRIGGLVDDGRASRSYAYIKVSDGCDHRCSFCAIPSIKGPYEALPLSQVLAQAEAALQEGARELVLVGQDTALWRDGREDLPRLLERLADFSEVARLRLLYLQPEHVTPALLKHMATSDKVCNYLDVPFQHASTPVLRRMRRWGSADEYLQLLARARDLMPDVSLRSTFIVGFPGETADDFETLLEFVGAAGLQHAGAFAYSPEGGTPAANLPDQVSSEVARSRLGRLSEALLSQSEAVLASLRGSRLPVLVDSVHPAPSAEGIIATGRTPGQAPEIDGVTFLSGASPVGLAPGDLRWADVTDLVGMDLIARLDEA